MRGLPVALIIAACGAPAAWGHRALHHARQGRDGLRRAGVHKAHGQAGHGQSAPAWKSHKELYPVEVSFDMQAMDAAAGISVVFDKKRRMMRVDQGLDPSTALAWGRFDDRIGKTGWSELTIDTAPSKEASNDAKAYSAGFAEGLLTCVRISDFHANTHALLMKREASTHALPGLRRLLRAQLSYMKERANVDGHFASEEPEDAYWRHARYVLFQLWGVCDGYNAAAARFGAPPLGLEDMLVLNAGAELPQLMQAYAPDAVEHRVLMKSALSFLQQEGRHGAPPMPGAQREQAAAASGAGEQEDALDDAHWEKRLEESGRCSALVRVTSGRQDLLVGHTTWDDYSKMTRIFKYYRLHLTNAQTVASHIAFSSYPGVVSSTDDFYVTDSGLVAMETSIEVLDPSAWDRLGDFASRPHLPSFVHTMVTTRLAKSASHWARLYSSQAGASASQWMVVDYNLFEAGKPVKDGTLWVLETLPGVAQMKDMSYFLREHGFWPSFNRPFFKEVREASGHAAAERSHGSLYSWSENPRAKIFAASAVGVSGLFDMRALMSRNKYAPASGVYRGPGHEISARMDLSPQQPVPNGGIDAKVVGRCLVRGLQVQAESGPSHAQQQAFRWRSTDGSELWPGWPHAGLPDLWDFDFVQLSPAGFTDVVEASAC